MKIDLQTNRKEILNLHKNNKTEKMVLREQAGDVYSKLKSMVDKGQIPDAVSIVELDTNNPDRKYAIKKKSVKNPGTFVYLFHDFKWGTFGTDGKFSYGNGVWVPKQPAEEIRVQTNITQDLAKAKEQGWKTEDEWRKAGVDWSVSDKLFDSKKIGNVTVYRYKKESTTFTPGVTGDKEFTAQEQEFINDLLDKGYEINLTPLQKQSWVAITAKELGAPPDLFPNGLVMYYDPNKQKGIDKKTSLLSDILDNQEINREACRKNVKDFYEAFKVRTVIEPAQMTKVKQVVQACNNQYYGQWGMLGGGNKLDYMLDVLSGTREGGPLKRDPFRLDRARKIKY